MVWVKYGELNENSCNIVGEHVLLQCSPAIDLS